MITEKDLVRFTKEYKTPAYIFDIDELYNRIKNIKARLPRKVELCYAMKANSFLVEALKDTDIEFEVCSFGEFLICEREKTNMKNIVLSGVYKSYDDMDYIISKYGSDITYTLESLNQLEIINSIAVKENLKLNVLIRITSKNQFGIDPLDIIETLKKPEKVSNVVIKGVQYYSGTQKKKSSVFLSELTYMDEICEKIKNECGITIEKLEYGPGLFVPYFEKEFTDAPYADLEALSEAIEAFSSKYEITLEMGRYIAAGCGVYVTNIVDIKVNDNRKYCIVDGGINHLSYYGQTMAMKMPKINVIKNAPSSQKEDCTICGALCTVSDILLKNLTLDNPALGDSLVFYNVGAYSVTEGIYLFLSRDLPFVFMYGNGNFEMKRENLQTNKINSRYYLTK